MTLQRAAWALPLLLVAAVLLAQPVLTADAQSTPTANSHGSYTVPADWPLKPAGLNPGDEFRLLFLTNTHRDASSTDIAVYNTHVQNAITNNGHTDIRAYGSLFKVVGSTSTVAARENTRMNPSTSAHIDAPIYWLNGPRVASGKAAFWGDTWENWAVADRRIETGAQETGNDWPWTGTQTNGDREAHNYLGNSIVGRGIFWVDSTSQGPIQSIYASSNTESHSLYGISPRFRVGNPSGYTLTLSFSPADTTYIKEDNTGNQNGQQVSLVFTLNKAAPAGGIDLGLLEFQTGHWAFVGGDTQIASGQSSHSVVVGAIREANVDRDRTSTYTYHNDPGFDSVTPASGISLRVRDTDPTFARLSGSDAEQTEGRTATFLVELTRALTAGETIVVPLSITGASDPATDFTLTRNAGASNTGVTLDTTNPAAPKVTFSGAGARIAALDLQLLKDGIDEPGVETITVALGSETDFNSQTGTNVGGGADPTYLSDGVTTQRFSLRVMDTRSFVQFRTCAGTVSAPSSALVANLGQTSRSSGQGMSNGGGAHAQSFTTGPRPAGYAAGYTLTSVDIGFHAINAAATLNGSPGLEVTIRSAGINPGASLGTLTRPTLANSSSAQTYTFTHSGLQLQPNTTYWLVVEFPALSGNNQISSTDSNNEDGGGASGWSISDTSIVRNADSTTWGDNTQGNIQFRVNGWATGTEDTCSTGWVETAEGDPPPTITLTEGGAPATYYWRVQDDANRTFSWIWEEVARSPHTYGGYMGAGGPDRDRLICHTGMDLTGKVNSHWSIGALITDEYLQLDVDNMKKSGGHAGVGRDRHNGCPFATQEIHWHERTTAWRPVSIAAGHDSDAFNHTTHLTHAPAVIGGTMPTPAPVKVRVNIEDDDSWENDVVIAADNNGSPAATWTAIDDGGWSRAFPAELPRVTLADAYECTPAGVVDPGVGRANWPWPTDSEPSHTFWVRLANDPSTLPAGARQSVGFCMRTSDDHTLNVGLGGAHLHHKVLLKSNQDGSLLGRDTGATGGEIDVTYTPVKVEIYVGHCIEDDPNRMIESSSTDTSTTPWTVTSTTRTVSVSADVRFAANIRDLYQRVDTDFSPNLRTDRFTRWWSRTSTATDPGSDVVLEVQGLVSQMSDYQMGDSPPPTLTIVGDALSVTEGGDVTYTITANPPPAAADITVGVAIKEQMGSGDNLVSREGRELLVIPAGASSVKWTVTAYSDDVERDDGAIVAELVADPGYSLGDPSSVSMTLLDDDEPPSVQVKRLSDTTATIAWAPQEGAARYNLGWYNTLGLPKVQWATTSATELRITGLDPDTRYAVAVLGSTKVGDIRVTTLKTGAEPQTFEVSFPTDTPPDPVVSVTGGSGITEGGSASFTVSASPAPSADLDVKVTVTQSGDYGATTGQRTVTIPTTGSVTFTVGTTDDQADETDGLVTATVNAGSGYTVSSYQGAATVSVSDNDPDPVVSITSSLSGSEGESISFTVSANPAPTAALPVSVTVTTTGDFGFGSAPTSVTIPTSGSVTLTITTTNDKVDEPDGSVTLTLNAGSGYTLGATSTESAQVTDDDDPGLQTIVVSIAGGDGITEGGSASFTVSASPAPATDLDVTVTVSQSGDYGATTGQRTVTIPTSGSATFTVGTTDDSADETDGSVTATLVDGTDYNLGSTKTATVTVSDNDDAPDYTDYQTLVDHLIEIRDNPVNTAVRGNPVHIRKWNRVLAAIGYDSGESPMPESEIHANAAKWPESSFKLASDYLKSLESQPVISISGGNGITEGGNASFTLSASPAPAANLDVKVTVTQSGDYGATTGQRTVTVPTTGSVSFTVGTTDDSADEADGSVTATVNAGSGYTVSSSQGAATVSVADNDDAPTPEISITGGSGITEGGSASFTVSASPAPSTNLDVKVTVTQSGDYGATTGQRTVTIPTSGSASFTVGTTDDSADETDGSVTATVNAGSGYTVSSSQGAATVSVADNDDAPTPEISISGGNGITEGGSASFTLSASPAPSANLDVKVTVTQSGDYGANTGQRTVTIPTSGSVSFTVGTTDDSADETDGSVTATVNAGTGYTVSSSQGAATVSVADNDDAPTPEISISGGNGITEGGSASFTVSASPAPAANLDVKVTVTQSGDYGATTGQRTVTIPTSGSVSFTVGTTDDSADETDGSVTATVNAGSGYTVSSTQSAATVSVADNDDAPTPEISITGGSGITEGGSASFTLSASPAPASNLDVRVMVTQSGDYGATTGQRTVTIPTSGSVSFTVGTTDDSADETDGSVTATVNAGTGYTVSSSQGAATVSVADNDDTVQQTDITITVDAASATEGNILEFQVNLSAASTEQITLTWYTAPAYDVLDDRAHLDDYQATTGEMVFEPGVTSQKGEVWLEQDSQKEPDEYFAIEVYLPGSFFLPDATGTMTIVDDD